MTWAGRRRLTISLIAGAIVMVLIAIGFTTALYKAPSCTDNKLNQNETGVDCGGSCSYLCNAQVKQPVVLFTKLLINNSGRTDVVASVENKNTDAAARNVSYVVTLYAADQSIIRELGGTLDLPPRTTVPVFMPNVLSGGETATRAFLEIASTSPKWFALSADPRIVPIVSNTTLTGAASTPRVEAVLANPSVSSMKNVRVIVLVHGAGGNIIAASATVVSAIPAQGRATATFTWNETFSSTLSLLEVVPIIPLP